jgi:hypothetical protein
MEPHTVLLSPWRTAYKFNAGSRSRISFTLRKQRIGMEILKGQQQWPYAKITRKWANFCEIEYKYSQKFRGNAKTKIFVTTLATSDAGSGVGSEDIVAFVFNSQNRIRLKIRVRTFLFSGSSCVLYEYRYVQCVHSLMLFYFLCYARCLLHKVIYW